MTNRKTIPYKKALVLLAATSIVVGGTTLSFAEGNNSNRIDDNQLSYTGSWSTSTGVDKYNGSDHYSDVSGNSFSYSFTGTSFDLLGAKAPWHGKAEISIDGKVAGTIDSYAATRQDQVKLFQKTGLSNTLHKVVVKVLGTHNSASSGNVVAIDALDIMQAVVPAPTSTSSTPTSSLSIFDDNAASYSGSWSTGTGSDKYEGSDHYSDVAGNSFSYSFTGTGVRLYGAQAPWHGKAEVSIDGKVVGTTDSYSANRQDQVKLFEKTGLANTSHKIVVKVLGIHNSASSGNVVAFDKIEILKSTSSPVVTSPASTAPTAAPTTTPTKTPTASPTTSTTPPVASSTTSPPATNVMANSFVTRNGNTLVLDGKTFRFAGTNEYYLGLDDNIRDAQGNPTYPTKFRIDDALNSAKSTGATVVRAHSIGISVGCSVCFESSLGKYNDSALASSDYAIAAAKARGIKLMVPLTDQWRFYHGGISTFTGWFGYANNPNTSQTAANNSAQRSAESNFYTDPKVISAYQDYISHVLNHVNPYTGLAYKDDPTIMAWETGNEIWTANPTWTQNIASYIKNTVKAKQLVADGSAASGMHVSNAAIDAKDIDIVGGHFYPVDVNFMRDDAAVAAAHNKVYMVGEFAWTDQTATNALIKEVESNKNISGDLYWTLMPHMENGSPEPHDDGYSMYSPAIGDTNKTILNNLITHAQKMNQYATMK